MERTLISMNFSTLPTLRMPTINAQFATHGDVTMHIFTTFHPQHKKKTTVNHSSGTSSASTQKSNESGLLAYLRATAPGACLRCTFIDFMIENANELFNNKKMLQKKQTKKIEEPL